MKWERGREEGRKRMIWDLLIERNSLSMFSKPKIGWNGEEKDQFCFPAAFMRDTRKSACQWTQITCVWRCKSLATKVDVTKLQEQRRREKLKDNIFETALSTTRVQPSIVLIAWFVSSVPFVHRICYASHLENKTTPGLVCCKFATRHFQSFLLFHLSLIWNS